MEATHWDKDIAEKCNKKDIRRRRQGFFWEQQMIWRNEIGELYSILFWSFSLLSYLNNQSYSKDSWPDNIPPLYIFHSILFWQKENYVEPFSQWRRERTKRHVRSCEWRPRPSNLLLPIIVLRSTGMRKQNWRYHILWLLGWILTYRNSIPIGRPT